MTRRQLGTLIRDCRDHLDLTQFEMSALLGCSQSRVSKIEAGVLEPGAIELGKLIKKIADVDVWVIIEMQIRSRKESK